MSQSLRFGDVEDPTVIDDILIRKEIQKYKEENKILSKGEIPLHEITDLSLSYKNILKLQNLQGLDRLERLQLDNNTIAKIENLDHLVNLKWLDLSFNCIEHISGLEKLVKLEDLTLYSNLITEITGLKTLHNLNVLSIGNNKLTSVVQMIQHLQWLENLEVLNMAGNDWDEPEYQKKVIPVLKHLKYIDYVFIEEDNRKKYIRDGNFNIGNAEDEAKDKEKKKEEEEQREFEMLNIIKLYKYDEKLLKDSPLLIELLELPDTFDSSFGMFKDTVKNKIKDFKGKLTDGIAKKKHYIENFKKAMKILEKKKEKDIASLLAIYQRQKFHCDLDYEEKVPEWRENCEKILVELGNLDRKLMTRELELVSSLEEIKNKHKDHIEDVYKTIAKTDIGAIGKDISEIIENFFENFKADAKAEEERRKPAEEDADESNIDITNTQDIYADSNDPIGEEEDPFGNLMTELKTQVSEFKEALDTRHKEVIANLTVQFSREKKNYLDGIDRLLNERNRESVKNIMSFMRAETEHWNLHLES